MSDQNLQDPVVAEPTTVEATADNTATPDSPSSSPITESGKDDTEDKVSQEGDEKLTVEELKRKYSESSKEARLRKEEAESSAARAKQAEEELLATVTKDRETFEGYLDRKGLTPEDKAYYLSVYDTQINKGQQPTAPTSQASTPPSSEGQAVMPPTQPVRPAQPNPVREQLLSQMEAEELKKREARKIASDEFKDAPENRDLPDTALSAIWSNAYHVEQTYGVSPREALAKARKIVLETDALKDEGYVEGVRDFASGISRGVSGSGKPKGSAFSLPKKHQAFVDTEAEKRGMNAQQKEEFTREYVRRLNSKQDD